MQLKKSNESGSIMVEVIAVLALLGVMGTMMFRQVQRRNEELDNINMASEIRMVKEATMAYIQANKAMLEADTNRCPAIGEADVMPSTLPLADVEKFLPDNWISDSGLQNGIIHEYDIHLSCYRVNSPAADNRLAMYATIVPKASPDGPMPNNFSLRRAARVATLIGADGGIYENGNFVGTMGAWEVPCSTDNGGDGSCDGRTDEFYVATTGMDVYIPETENKAENTVAVPNDIAFDNLHSANYFSVGEGNVNCVGNTTAVDGGYMYAHENLTTTGANRVARDDEIRRVGTGDCDPLFWVGTPDDGGNDRSDPNHVYVKNNLYVGRDNAHDRQAVAITTGASNADHAITVFDVDGRGTVTLNAEGRIVGRVDSTGRGYRLDAANGEIVLFQEVNANVNGSNHTVQVPTLRLRDGRMETNVNAQYYDDAGTLQTEVYAVDPAGESLMNDIRLTARGGARLSDILSDYILKGTQTITRAAAGTSNVNKPTCPTGYAAAISVTPVRYSQYVKAASLDLNLVTSNRAVSLGDGVTGHTHNVVGNVNMVTQSISGNTNGNTLTVTGSGGSATTGYVNGTTLTLTQLPPVNVAIASPDATHWTVGLTYGAQNPTADDPITARVETYCVFQDTTNRAISADAAAAAIAGEAGLRIEAKSAAVITNKVCGHIGVAA